MDALNTRAERIAALLERELAPDELMIRDDSGKHARHAGRNGVHGTETHFAIMIRSARFAGMARIARHRLVHELLATEFSSGLHALSLDLQTPAASAHG